MQHPSSNSSVPLIDGLMRPEAYPHSAEALELVETHISWLLLAGPFAYKIKKPVNLGFVDFSDLGKRKHFCEEELRLNRRFSPELYLEATPIGGTETAPRVGSEPAIEYAVKMVRFPDSARLDRVAERGELTAAHCDALAEAIAAAHRTADAASPDGPFGLPERIDRQTADTLSLAERHLPVSEHPRLQAIRTFCQAEFRRIAPQLVARRAAGRVRECHGDLHLENMLLADDRIRLFDCLEFNPSLRWIDVMSDVAFAAMDLEDRDHARLAARLLNRYLELTGDYGGLDVLTYYQVYRATVRAAVAGVRLQSPQLAPADCQRYQRKADAYLRLAETYTRPRRPVIVITHGLPGTGKSTLTEPLVEWLPAIRLRSDVERRRLEEHAPASQSADRYAPAMRRRVYEQMAAAVEQIVSAGYSAIVDATFLKRADRQLLADVSRRQGVPLFVLRFEASDYLLRQRIAQRLHAADDPSEATPAALEALRREVEPLSDEESAQATVLDVEGQGAAEIAARIRGD